MIRLIFAIVMMVPAVANAQCASCSRGGGGFSVGAYTGGMSQQSYGYYAPQYAPQYVEQSYYVAPVQQTVALVPQHATMIVERGLLPGRLMANVNRGGIVVDVMANGDTAWIVSTGEHWWADLVRAARLRTQPGIRSAGIVFVGNQYYVTKEVQEACAGAGVQLVASTPSSTMTAYVTPQTAAVVPVLRTAGQ